jgi:hypothetical protein
MEIGIPLVVADHERRAAVRLDRSVAGPYHFGRLGFVFLDVDDANKIRGISALPRFARGDRRARCPVEPFALAAPSISARCRAMRTFREYGSACCPFGYVRGRLSAYRQSGNGKDD